MTMEREDKERFSRRYTPEDDDLPQSKKTANPLLLLGVAVVLSVLVSMMWVNNANFASGDDFSALKDTIDKSQSSITASINNIPNVVTTQVNTAIGNINTQLSNIQNIANDAKTQVTNQNSKIDNAVASIASLTSKVDSLTKANSSQDAKITALEAKITALETHDGSSSSESELPVGLSIDVDVKDEGEIINTDNLTKARIKITIENETGYDLEDLELQVFVYIEYCEGDSPADYYLTKSSGSGSWRITDREIDEMCIRGTLSYLDDGDTEKIYLNIFSYSENSEYGEPTYIEVDDFELKSWDYS